MNDTSRLMGLVMTRPCARALSRPRLRRRHVVDGHVALGAGAVGVRATQHLRGARHGCRGAAAREIDLRLIPRDYKFSRIPTIRYTRVWILRILLACVYRNFNV
jgi:hypothetical protein